MHCFTLIKIRWPQKDRITNFHFVCAGFLCHLILFAREQNALARDRERAKIFFIIRYSAPLQSKKPTWLRKNIATPQSIFQAKMYTRRAKKKSFSQWKVMQILYNFFSFTSFLLQTFDKFHLVFSFNTTKKKTSKLKKNTQTLWLK